MSLVEASPGVPECSGGAPDEGGAAAVVMVGVKLDSLSKELLTWALVKVAQSGDRVIALHILDPKAGENSQTPKLPYCVCFGGLPRLMVLSLRLFFT